MINKLFGVIIPFSLNDQEPVIPIERFSAYKTGEYVWCVSSRILHVDPFDEWD
jgi:hypothetical protein